MLRSVYSSARVQDGQKCLDAPWDLGEDWARPGQTRFPSLRESRPCSPRAGIAAAGAAKPNQQLIKRHGDEHRLVFPALELDLGTSPAAKLPTDERSIGYNTTPG
jgi:hypothetical protein